MKAVDRISSPHPIGSFGGGLATLTAPKLGAVVKAALERAGISGDQVNEIFMGNVLSAGIGQAPKRRPFLQPEYLIPLPLPPLKVCASGHHEGPSMIGAQSIMGTNDIVVLRNGEHEHVKFNPQKERWGAKLGH